ncbi:DUF4316 domain-containing protein, partial [Dysosmobacter welbionis]
MSQVQRVIYHQGGGLVPPGCYRVLHADVAQLVVDVVLALGVDVLHVLLVVDQVGDRADEVLAGVEHIQHGDALLVKGEAVMHLHLAVDAGVVAALEVHPLPLHQSADALRAVAAPDGRVSHAVDAPVLEVWVLGLNAPYLPRHLGRFHLHAGVGGAGAAVILPDAVEPPVPVHGVPAHGEGPGVAPVQAAPDGPVLRDL